MMIPLNPLFHSCICNMVAMYKIGGEYYFEGSGNGKVEEMSFVSDVIPIVLF